ncbi:hypothetical protein [Roseibium sediminis]|uniref:hypothetical protein n=1 Tax=Roseibium sediminis TaxID=1775174 RepID=UPI00123D7CFD|nr:hypothetical protein [Roseibium sediminis]
MKHLFLIAAFFLLTFATHASSTEEKFRTAIQAWLSDDDETSLNILSALAKEGDTNARLMLGRITDRPGAFSPYMLSLSRKERNTLLKAPGGLSGTSWLSVIEKDSQIAAAHLKAKNIQNGVPGIRELLELGEVGPATGYMFRQLHQGNQSDLVGLASIETSSDGAKFVLWIAALNNLLVGKPISSETMATLENFAHELDKYDLRALVVLGHYYSMLSPSDKLKFAGAYTMGKELIGRLNFGLINESEKSISRTAASVALMHSNHTKGIVQLCKQECESSTEACVKTIFGAVGGIHGLLELQTPVEVIIPSEQYFESKRYQVDLMRVAYIVFEEKGWKTPPGTLDRNLEGKVDQCIADKVLSSSAEIK